MNASKGKYTTTMSNKKAFRENEGKEEPPVWAAQAVGGSQGLLVD
jgi:hypothetical protein